MAQGTLDVTVLVKLCLTLLDLWNMKQTALAGSCHVYSVCEHKSRTEACRTKRSYTSTQWHTPALVVDETSVADETNTIPPHPVPLVLSLHSPRLVGLALASLSDESLT